jgi:hypothetical protein
MVMLKEWWGLCLVASWHTIPAGGSLVPFLDDSALGIDRHCPMAHALPTAILCKSSQKQLNSGRERKESQIDGSKPAD